jgi:tripartite-type tricarboxylate transporter receptor subunit TctC
MMMRRPLLRLALALPAASLASGRARAAGYPDKPIRLVVAFPPGGPSDVLGRIVGRQLNTELGQAIIVDNRPGAGGNVAAEIVAKATADGYTLLVANNSILAANQFLYRHIPYDPIKDFAPITLLGSQPNILVVNPSLPVHSVADLIALAKAKPGQLNFGSSGNGTAAHLAGELFRLRAGVDIVHVAYPGAAAALTDLVSGQIQMMFATAASVVSFIRNKMLRPLAVTTLTRSATEPDLPTVAESGLPGFEAVTWHGLVAPAGTPGPIVARLNAATLSALRNADVAKQLGNLGVEVAGGTPEAFAAYIKADAAKWGEVIRAAHIHIG